SAQVLRQIEEMVEVLAKAIKEKSAPPLVSPGATGKPSERARRATPIRGGAR
ncbi:MAG: hypothetical protein H8F28_05155, partial [Fibrella sp.]|nr:hypothetical protein [Armatimonadota bacterium]